ncbi:MAG: hypothetical protein IJ679_07065, partial [Lachnospiraceae bacterium]|nr:hypothetical protein [Lachnospiraceae bacterium]
KGLSKQEIEKLCFVVDSFVDAGIEGETGIITVKMSEYDFEEKVANSLQDAMIGRIRLAL